MPERRSRPPLRIRLAAAAALASFLVTLGFTAFYTVHHLLYFSTSLLAGGFALCALWTALTNRHLRGLATALGLAALGGVLASMIAAGRGVAAVLVMAVGFTVTEFLGSIAFRWEIAGAAAARWRPVRPSKHGVVLMNPRSGDGKVEALGLVEEARRRGIEAVVIEEGADLHALAEAAVVRGADVLGMAGGDGSQAVVAAVAADHDLAYVCVPAGTRNHLALDLGVKRDDVVGALDAFGEAREATIDLATVNDTVFVNNVSLGVYAEIVASDEYRNAKGRTAVAMLPDLVEPNAAPFDLHIDSPQGPVDNPHVVQISNNPYALSTLGGFGTRFRLDRGRLGIVTVRVGSPLDVPRLVALNAAGRAHRFDGWRDWTAATAEVRSNAPVAVGLDGEARTLEPPLRFAIRPGALRVRIAPGHPGVSPAATRAPIRTSTLPGLVRLALGRPSGITS